jgi:prepilin-type N-terminal cleavage/methylation domain-containing protein
LKKQNNSGFSLVEVLVAIVVLSAIVIPVCSSILLSVRMNAKADDMLQARVAVSSAVETLMAQGITHANNQYDIADGKDGKQDLFPDVTISTTADPNETEPAYYTVTVTDTNQLVTVTTKIRAVEPVEETTPDGTTETTAPDDQGGGQ